MAPVIKRGKKETRYRFSWTASSTISGSVSSFTPRTSKRSALPHLLDTDRFSMFGDSHPAARPQQKPWLWRYWMFVPHLHRFRTYLQWLGLKLEYGVLYGAWLEPLRQVLQKFLLLVASAAISAPICASVTFPEKISVIILDIWVSLRSIRCMILIKIFPKHNGFPPILVA